MVGSIKKAKVYVNDKLCGSLPATIKMNTVYKIDCDANYSGDFIRITSDDYLAFSEVEVFNKIKKSNAVI